MSIPIQCQLWQKENLTKEDLHDFEVMRTYVDESHFMRYLLKCKECGQLYFYEFYETIDWENGNDPQYKTFIPVDSEDEAKKRSEASLFDIFEFSPCIRSDWPSDIVEPRVRWVGRNRENKIMPESIVEKAAKIAMLAHKDQLRKCDDLPYIIHPFMVALKLAKYNFSDTIIAAALAHDVLEDTNYPEENLRKELGDEVMEIVKAVTNDNTLSWEEKKMKYVETVRTGPEGAKAVSVADKIHNLESLFQAYILQGAEVWKNFNRGKEKKLWFENEVLKMLKENWDHPLIAEYETLLGQAENLEEESEKA